MKRGREREWKSKGGREEREGEKRGRERGEGGREEREGRGNNSDVVLSWSQCTGTVVSHKYAPPLPHPRA